MEFVSDMFGRLVILAGVGFAFAVLVMQKYAERHPQDAKRLQVKAGKAAGAWARKRLK